MSDLFAIPTVEPSRLRAGETWAWDRPDLAAYASAAYTVTYTLRPVGGGAIIVLTAGVVDGALEVRMAASATGVVAPGDYEMTGQVVRNADLHTVTLGLWHVFIDAAADSTADARSHDEKMLAAIEATLEGRAVKDVESYSIEGRALTRIPFAELERLRQGYARRVARARGRGGIAQRAVCFT
ncbi:MAG: hypothetical protein AAF899_10045 [Pseudomonadota bacterium]